MTHLLALAFIALMGLACFAAPRVGRLIDWQTKGDETMPYFLDEKFGESLAEKFNETVGHLVLETTNDSMSIAHMISLVAHYRTAAAEAIGWKNAADQHITYLERRVEELEARERARMGGG